MHRNKKYFLLGIMFILVQGVIAISDSNLDHNIKNITVNVVETKKLNSEVIFHEKC